MRLLPLVSSPKGVIAIYLIALVALVGGLAPHALPVVLLDLLSALIVLAPPALAGLWLMPLLGLNHLPRRWHLIIGSVLGIGGFCLLALAGGCAGLLGRFLWLGVLVALAGLGIIRWRQLISREADSGSTAGGDDSSSLFRLLWLITVPFAAIGLLAASNPPGVIWSEEGFGYDILEYHLQMPKEYVQADEIFYARHNVYANFPSNVEMLYMVNMVVRGTVLDTGTTANMIHLLLGVLSVAVVWCACTTFCRCTGLLAGVLLGAVGWLPYLAGLAYVELGLLLFGTLAVVALLQAMHGSARPEDNSQNAAAAGAAEPHRWLVVAGLSVGLACGCKYTAVPMIALPAVLGSLLVGNKARSRIRNVLVVAGLASLSFAPWLVKNALMTGNPVFPLAHGVFETYPPGWDKVVADRWNRAHGASPVAFGEADPDSEGSAPTALALLAGRIAKFWRHVIGDHYQRFGLLILLAPLLVAVARPRVGSGGRIVMSLVLVLAIQLSIWLFATHLFARFAVPLLIPLSVLGGLGLARFSSRFGRIMLASVMVLGSLWNLVPLTKLYLEESHSGLPPSTIYAGEVPAYVYYGIVNKLNNSHTLLIGEARAFYFSNSVDYFTTFNTHPFIEQCERHTDPELLVPWLREQGYTHVLVNWLEVNRLSRTYGYSSAITPQLFHDLRAAGLRLVWESSEKPVGNGQVQLFTVPTVQ